MIARALIVVLAVLNLGVATWWLLRPEPGQPQPPAPLAGVATLELVRTRAEAPAAPAAAPAAPVAPTCLRAGPFRSRAAAVELQSRLDALVARSELEEEEGEAGMFRVLLPPAASRSAADETVERLQAAGFTDVLVLQQGGDANTVALGTFRNRAMAERRVEAMRQLGFPAELRPMGNAQPPRWWLLLATSQPEQVREIAGQTRPIDCGPLAGPAGGR